MENTKHFQTRNHQEHQHRSFKLFDYGTSTEVAPCTSSWSDAFGWRVSRLVFLSDNRENPKPMGFPHEKKGGVPVSSTNRQWRGETEVENSPKKRSGKIHHAMKMGKSTISTGPFSIANC